MSVHGTASETVRGTFVEFATAVLRNLPRDLDADVELGWANNGDALARALRTALMPNGASKSEAVAPPTHPEPTQTVIRVRRDYGQSVKDQVKAGEYDWKNGDVNDKHFPYDRSLGVVEGEVVLVHFNRTMTSDGVEAELDRMGLKPADHVTLLGIGSGSETRDLQRQFPIVALGSVASFVGLRSVACLGRDVARRDLDLVGRRGDWIEVYRFAAVRK